MKVYSLSIVLFSTLLFYSCGESKEKEVSQYDQVLQLVENAVTPKLNDPKSYEFVELVLVDSVLIKDNVEYRLNYFSHNLEFAESRVEVYKGYKSSESFLFDSLSLKSQENNVLEYKEILKGIDSIKVSLNDRLNDVASYTYSYTFRGNNKMGALVLNTYLIQTDPLAPFEVINIAENEDELFLIPNQFEGYLELVKPIIEKYK